MPIFNPAFETASREQIRARQLELLKEQIQWIWDHSAYYRPKLEAIGFEPGDLKSLDDLVRLPFTDKSALRDTYPYGMFAVPMEQVIRLHASSGTTGKPIVVGYNQHDIEEWRLCIESVMQMAGVVPGDRVQMAFGYGMFTGGFGLHYGAEGLGCMIIPAGAGNTERHLMQIADYGTTVLVATPSYAMHICEVGEQQGFDWASSTLRVGLFGGEPCPPALKAEIESRMHIFCTDNYGLTEVMGPGVSGECLVSRNQQHINEDHFFWEVVDPQTGEPVGEGEIGELVLTPLQKQAFPVLRYRTHDLTRVTTEPCGCGRSTARMDKIRSRTDDMLIIRGTNFFPSQVEDVLAQIEEVSPIYRIEVDNETGLDRVTLTLELENEVFTDDWREIEKYRKMIIRRLHDVLQFNVVLKLVNPGQIERTTGKAKHVLDHRR
jgi:phenylacetate-CoA ligase